MNSISSISSASTTAPAPAAAGSPSTATPASTAAQLGPAASLELSSAQQEGVLVNAMLSSFSSSSSGGAAFNPFGGASTLSLLNAQGNSALPYVTPAPAGQNVNALA
jgi:hypothetical protein